MVRHPFLGNETGSLWSPDTIFEVCLILLGGSCRMGVKFLVRFLRDPSFLDRVEHLSEERMLLLWFLMKPLQNVSVPTS